MDKVKVSREIETAFKEFIKFKKDKSEIMKEWFELKEEDRPFHISYSHLRQINFDEIVALIQGNYEVEQTPEEKLLDFYNLTFSYDKDLIRTVLKLLNIEIEGINKFTPQQHASASEERKVQDYPTEDTFGSEIVEGDRYCIIGDDIVLNQNLDVYITEYLHGQICKAK